MRYRIGVDIGGTFTDCVVADERGGRTVSKAPSTPGSLQDGVLEAVGVNAEQLGVTRPQLLAATDLFVHGTTQATNAMLTRSGARTGLITTKGHEDAIIIGKVYAKVAGLPERDLVHSSRLRKPDPIVPRSLIRGVTERVDRDGDVIVALQEGEVIAAIDSLLAAGVEAIAVSLLWSFVNDAHERRIKELLTERAPHLFTAYSHEVAPVLGEYERTATTAITAYVGPKVVGYLERLESQLREEGLAQPLLVMQASGGLTSVLDAAQRPIVTLDSGPTGGILGCQHLGRLYGESNVICTDVGGTSFDVGLILRGEVPLEIEPVVAQYSLRMPKVLVNSIGSGGGSIAWLDEGGLLRVGPQSAGSRPGPACYANGGTEPTVTDADLVLGYLDADSFLGGRMRLDRELALRALSALGARLGMEAEEVAVGVFRIINSQMADLIRKSTIEQGHDPRECVLVAYGGAGPTHAVFYGHEIGSKAIFVLADSTVFSAEGMLTCDVTHTAEASRVVSTPFTDESLAGLTERFTRLEQRVIDQFALEGAGREEISLARTLGVRFRQQVHTVEVGVDPGPLDAAAGDRVLERFVERYGLLYGEGALLLGGGNEVELHRVVGTRRIEPVAFPEHDSAGPDASAALKGERSAYFEPVGFTATRVYDGDALRAGNEIDGPAIIERMGDSVVVPPEFRAQVDRLLTIRLGAAAAPAANGAGFASRAEAA
ncbi:MAG TPA: hydantoinase/oxoprolinase family protein [Solirubrobacteraceae bacterium]|nr:hydantoinase/oxoprolinase family protein [Solirubrobacteraceae bacterium]